MSFPGIHLDPPVDTVGDGTEYAGAVEFVTAFGTTDWWCQGGFETMAAASAWAKAIPAPAGWSKGHHGAYRVLREEHR